MSVQPAGGGEWTIEVALSDANGNETTAQVTIFVDIDDPELSAYGLYDAFQDDLVILDADGVVRHHVSLLSFVLDEEPNRTTLDGWVRTLLR